MGLGVGEEWDVIGAGRIECVGRIGIAAVGWELGMGEEWDLVGCGSRVGWKLGAGQ